jgi:phage antirepressor YoqD-like protein
VLRWEQLERERLGVRIPEQRLLVTEKEILMKGDEIRRSSIASENADADGCFTVRQIAEMMQTTVKELNKQLVKAGIQFWNGGRYKLTEQYADSGLAQERSFHYFSLEGEKKERKYLVWTKEGVEFILSIEDYGDNGDFIGETDGV